MKIYKAPNKFSRDADFIDPVQLSKYAENALNAVKMQKSSLAVKIEQKVAAFIKDAEN